MGWLPGSAEIPAGEPGELVDEFRGIVDIEVDVECAQPDGEQAGVSAQAARICCRERTTEDPHLSATCHPDSDRVTASFAALAKRYGVSVAICPPGAGTARTWWTRPTKPRRSVAHAADEVTVEAAQASLDRWCALRGDTRLRLTGDGRAIVAVVARPSDIAGLVNRLVVVNGARDRGW